MRKTRQFVLLTFLFSSLITSCTTVSDFQKMTPQQRAEAVCKRQQVFRDMADREEALRSKIADAQSALSAGYRVHKQCRQVKVYGDATTNCSTVYNYTSCHEQRPESYETQCTETPVSISPDLERSNIASWSQEADFLDRQAREKWQQCFQAVFRMSPEEAYKHY